MSAHRDLAWQNWAECLFTDPDVFFPDKGGNPRIAYAICAQCPVQQECLDYAIGNQITWGIWGGMSYKSRLALQREEAA